MQALKRGGGAPCRLLPFHHFVSCQPFGSDGTARRNAPTGKREVPVRKKNVPTKKPRLAQQRKRSTSVDIIFLLTSRPMAERELAREMEKAGRRAKVGPPLAKQAL